MTKIFQLKYYVLASIAVVVGMCALYSVASNSKWSEEKANLYLINAVQADNGKDIELSIEKGAAINARGKTFRWTALELAAWDNELIAVKTLLKHHADVNTQGYKGYSPLTMASAQGHVEVVKLLLKHGADVNTQTDEGYAALTFAAFKNHIEIARLLLENGAKDVRSKTGLTALDIAVRTGHEQIARMIRENDKKN